MNAVAPIPIPVPPRRRGACPSLDTPMPSGDGLLVRLALADPFLPPASLAAIAKAAGRFGNGVVEVTNRGNLQIRGLRPATVEPLAEALNAAGIALVSGVPVETEPLAGLDGTEIADSRTIAEALRTRLAATPFAARLGPKLSVVVDGGGRLSLARLSADVRLVAERTVEGAVWRVGVGGTSATARPVGCSGDPGASVGAVLALLERIAERGPDARGRDLSKDDLAAIGTAYGLAATFAPVPAPRLSPVVGRHPLKDGRVALCLALPFGAVDAAVLQALARAAGSSDCTAIRPAPGKAMLTLLPSGEAAARLGAGAKQLGFIVEPADPRLRIIACAGRPACASAHLDTRALGRSLAEARPRGTGTIHLSGCSKRCADPGDAALHVVGTAEGADLVRNGRVIAHAQGGGIDAALRAALGTPSRERSTEAAAGAR